jgi:hypothetical protein
MQIVWDKEAIKELRKKHTVLELETFPVNGEMFSAWCVVPAEKISTELANINAYVELHEGFIKAFKEKDAKLCNDIAEHLMGKFGGELDTFYEEILSRINKTE